MTTSPPLQTPESDRQTPRMKHTISVEQYVAYRRDGFLIVRGLLPKEDVERLQSWADDLFHGRINLNELSPKIHWKPEEQQAEQVAAARLHMIHRRNATAEWGLLHPDVLDVLEALTGPDVLALQSMIFFNPPGKGGQGWHQDSFYIQTQPDTLIGAWFALDRADEQNGCLWVAPGSHHEPVYPPALREHFVQPDDRHIDGLFPATHASYMDDDINRLSRVAAKYGKSVAAVMDPGDVLFFHSHLLHRSYRNETADRFRRAYVCHYCNARSRVPWNHGAPYEGEAANALHILARGRTHLPFTGPAFGTPLELAPALPADRDSGSVMVAMPDDMMGKLDMQRHG